VKYFLATIFIALFLPLTAQNRYEISGSIRTEKGQPISYVTARLINKENASEVFSGISDDEGQFKVAVRGGEYFIECSFLGFEKYRSALKVSDNMKLDPITLMISAHAVREIVVNGSSIAYNANGFTLNVLNNPWFKGLDLKDILSISPGIKVDDKNISVYGKTVSKIYINERELKMEGSERINYLRMFDSKNIRKVEIIASSGVEDDAKSGNNSILKITTYDVQDGGSFRGAVNTNTGENLFYLTPLLNLNVRKGKISGYTRNSLPMGESKNVNLSRTLLYETKTQQDDESTNRNKILYNIPLTVGIGYDLDSCNLLSFEIASRKRKIETDRSINSIRTIDEILNETINSNIHYEDNAQIINLSANYVYLPKTGGKVIVKADLLSSNLDQEGQNSNLYKTSGQKKLSENQEGSGRTSHTLSADYASPFHNKSDIFNAGVKYSDFSSNNNTVYQTFVNDLLDQDESYTNHYRYKELIYAAYVKYTLKRKSWAYIFGVRMEHSNIKPQSEINPGENYNQTYTDFFPEIATTYFFNKRKGYQIHLDFNRSIYRPPFQFMNTYTHAESDFCYSIGNPFLKPAYDNTITLRTILWNQSIINASYSETEDIFDNHLFKDSVSEKLYYQVQNMASSKKWKIYATVPINVLKWWQICPGISYEYNTIKYPDSLYTGSHVLYDVQNSFRLPRNFRLNGYAAYSTSSIYGNEKTEPYYTFGADLFSTFFDDKLSVSLSASNILSSLKRKKTEIFSPDFYTMRRSATSIFRFGINVSYNFRWGKKSVKINQVESGNQSEQIRNNDK